MGWICCWVQVQAQVWAAPAGSDHTHSAPTLLLPLPASSGAAAPAAAAAAVWMAAMIRVEKNLTSASDAGAAAVMAYMLCMGDSKAGVDYCVVDVNVVPRCSSCVCAVCVCLLCIHKVLSGPLRRVPCVLLLGCLLQACFGAHSPVHTDGDSGP